MWAVMMLNLCYTYAVILMWLDECGVEVLSCYAILEGYLRFNFPSLKCIVLGAFRKDYIRIN